MPADALAVFIAIQILVPALIRPHLLPSTTATFPINQASTSQFHDFQGTQTDFHFGLPIPRGAWLTSQPPVKDSSGQVVRIEDYPDCFSDGGDAPDLRQIGACLAKDNLHQTVTYHPASHYWPLQWTETGIFLVLCGALVGTCFWWIRRRQN